MSTAQVFATVRAVQRDQLSAGQRDALAQLLLAMQVAIELDTKPGPEWRPAIAAFDALVADEDDGGGTAVTRLRRVGPS